MDSQPESTIPESQDSRKVTSLTEFNCQAVIKLAHGMPGGTCWLQLTDHLYGG